MHKRASCIDEDLVPSGLAARRESVPRARTGPADESSVTRIRVLHVIKTLALGGAETNLLNLARAFDPEKIETHVAYSFGGEIEERFRNAGATLFKYARRSHRVQSLHSVSIVLRLAKYIRTHRIDIVHTHNFNAHVWGAVAARLGGAKVLEHVHDFRYAPEDELARRGGLLHQYRFTRFFRNRSDRIVVLTGENASEVVRRGIATANQVTEIQNGIPLDEPVAADVGNFRERHGIASDAVVIATSARMDPTKNIGLIVAIAPHVLKLAPQCVFVIAGSGSHLEEYRTLAREAGLERKVVFTGFLDDMDHLLSESDVFLLPSFLELHSIALLEALRMSLPVVISQRVGCHAQFIRDGVNGFLCDPFAQRPWIDALVRLAGDPALRAEVGVRGHDTCRRLFDIKDTAARFQALYADLAA